RAESSNLSPVPIAPSAMLPPVLRSDQDSSSSLNADEPVDETDRIRFGFRISGSNAVKVHKVRTCRVLEGKTLSKVMVYESTALCQLCN
ncbi:hypothetical protein SARC_18058, partial [Sphaeroforma arctica JP610]